MPRRGLNPQRVLLGFMTSWLCAEVPMVLLFSARATMDLPGRGGGGGEGERKRRGERKEK